MVIIIDAGWYVSMVGKWNGCWPKLSSPPLIATKTWLSYMPPNTIDQQQWWWQRSTPMCNDTVSCRPILICEYFSYAQNNLSTTMKYVSPTGKHSSQHGNMSMDKFRYVSNLIILSTPFATTCLFSPILVSLPTKLLFSPIISCLPPTTHETSHTICVRRFSHLDPLTQIPCKFTHKKGHFT